MALNVEILGRLPVVGPGEGDYAAVGGDASALVPVEDAAGGVLAGGDGVAPGLALIFRVHIHHPLQPLAPVQIGFIGLDAQGQPAAG